MIGMTEKTFNGLNGTILLNTPSSPGLTVGYVSAKDYGFTQDRKLRVTVEMRLERAEQSDEYETTEHEMVRQPLDFALTTAVWNWNGTDHLEGGATVEPLRAVLRSGMFGEGFDAQKVAALIEMHEQYHLNGMQAGCDHQTPVWEDSTYGRRISLELTEPCPITGYKYGHKWLVKVLPEGFVSDLLAILADVDPSRVYVHPDLKS